VEKKGNDKDSPTSPRPTKEKSETSLKILGKSKTPMGKKSPHPNPSKSNGTHPTSPSDLERKLRGEGVLEKAGKKKEAEALFGKESTHPIQGRHRWLAEKKKAVSQGVKGRNSQPKERILFQIRGTRNNKAMAGKRLHLILKKGGTLPRPG